MGWWLTLKRSWFFDNAWFGWKVWVCGSPDHMPLASLSTVFSTFSYKPESKTQGETRFLWEKKVRFHAVDKETPSNPKNARYSKMFSSPNFLRRSYNTSRVMDLWEKNAMGKPTKLMIKSSLRDYTSFPVTYLEETLFLYVERMYC